MPGSFEESDSKAGFYYDLKFLTGLTYIVFLILTILSGFMLSIRIDSISLVFLSLFVFLDLQEFAEVRVPRYGWKGSRSSYRLASMLLAIGILLVAIADSLMNSGIITRLPMSISVALFLFSIGFLIIPILGILFYLIFILDFAHLHSLSLWARDKEIIEAYSEHSFFYRRLFRRKRQRQT